MRKYKRGGVHPITMRKTNLKSKRKPRVTLRNNPTLSRAQHYLESQRLQVQDRVGQNLTKKTLRQRLDDYKKKTPLRQRLDDYKKMPPPKLRISGTPQALSRRAQLLKSATPKVFKPNLSQRMFTNFVKHGATPQEAKKMIKKMRKTKTKRG